VLGPGVGGRRKGGRAGGGGGQRRPVGVGGDLRAWRKICEVAWRLSRARHNQSAGPVGAPLSRIASDTLPVSGRRCTLFQREEFLSGGALPIL